MIDETLYRLQACNFASGTLGWHLNDTLRPFFQLRQTFYEHGVLYSQYPPGWPFILSLFHRTGLEWFTGPFLGASVALTLNVLSRLIITAPQSRWLPSAILLASPAFLQESTTYYAHTVTMLLLMVGALLLILPSSASERGIRFFFGGLFLSAAITIRPVSGAAGSASVILWLLLTQRLGGSSGTVFRALLVIALGCVSPLLIFLLYNRLTTGSALTLGYAAANGSLHNLGFGTRGMIAFDASGSPYEIASSFGLANGLRNLLLSVRDALTVWQPLASSFAIVGFLGITRLKFSKVSVVFAILPLVQFFYFYGGERLWREMLPFAALGLGWSLAQISAAGHQKKVSSLMALLFLFGISTALLRARSTASWRDFYFAPAEKIIDDAVLNHGSIVAFISDPAGISPLLEALIVRNCAPFPGTVVVARDLGSDNELLLRHFPGYTPLYLKWLGPWDTSLGMR